MESGAAFLQLTLTCWGNASVTAQCDNGNNYAFHNVASGPYRECLDNEEVKQCLIAIRPARCPQCSGIHWNMSVVSGLRAAFRLHCDLYTNRYYNV